MRLCTSVIIAVFAGTGLTGCNGCEAPPHAAAQGLDAGAPIVVVPVPEYPGPAICYVQALRRTPLLDQQALYLCQGAPSAGPVACYNMAGRKMLFTDAQRIALCRCAYGTQPVECVEFLENETWLTDVEMLQLCSPTISGALLSNCRAVGGY